MWFDFSKIVFIALLKFCGIFAASIAYAEHNNSSFKVIVAAQMPEISDSVSGRYAELKHLVDDVRSEQIPTFFIFGGGSVGPSALANFDRGSHIIDLLNYVEPDAMGVSKREFSYFEEELSLRSYEALFPFVSSNIVNADNSNPLDGVVRSAIIEKHGMSVGFLSILDQRVIKEYLLTEVKILDPVSEITKLSKQLKAQGADFVLLHFFNELPSITNLLNEGIIDQAYMSNTLMVDSEVNKLKLDPRIIVQEHPGTAIESEYMLDEQTILKSRKTHVLERSPSDLQLERELERYKSRLDRLLDDHIGFWGADHTTKRYAVRGQENSFANFVVDAMLEFAQTDIALLNSGSVRGDKLYQRNQIITRRTIATELPFRSTISVVEITGNDLLAALEVGFSGIEQLKGAFPQIAGMTVQFDSSSAHGQRVKRVDIKGQLLDRNKTYRLATTDYLIAGGDGYDAFKNARTVNDDILSGTILVSDIVMRSLRVKGKIDHQIQGRIVDVRRDN